LIPVKEAGAKSLGTALKQLTKLNPAAMKAAKTFSTGTVAQREEAIKAIADQNFTLASDDIALALHDPSPRIRRQAALALARLNPPNAQDELIHQFESHPDLIEEETVDALGAIGNSSAFPVLVQALQSPRSLLRRSAAKAIGRIGSGLPEIDLNSRYAIEALMHAAQDDSDVDLRRAALQSLRVWGVPDAYNVISAAVLDPHASVRIAAAEAVEELGVEQAAEKLRLSLQQYSDEATAEVAYALGSVGRIEDLHLIVETAGRFDSMITSRRALLGAAHLLGVEAELYRLYRQEGMARDGALVNMLAPLAKKSKRVQIALDRYSNGDDSSAIAALASALPDDALNQLARSKTPGVFLLAACYAASRFS
jgi:HEAT repeat protein